jgi:hypothetical protein
MIHYIQQHDGKVRTVRTISCWSCAKQVSAQTLTCACGWKHPNKNNQGEK